MAFSRLAIAGISIALLAGCSSLPTCGTPAAKGVACSESFGSFLNEVNSTTPQRNYVTNPVTLPAPASTNQVTAPGSEEYRTVAVNTPDGIVYKRCKVLNGSVTACF